MGESQEYTFSQSLDRPNPSSFMNSRSLLMTGFSELFKGKDVGEIRRIPLTKICVLHTAMYSSVLGMCVCVCVRARVMCVLHTYACIYVMHVMYVCMYVCVYVCIMCVCMYVYDVYVCRYVCIYVCT